MGEIGAGMGEMSVHVRGKSASISVGSKQVENGVTGCTHLPKESGEYVVTVKLGGDQIPGSRFHVKIEPLIDASKWATTSGPGGNRREFNSYPTERSVW